MLARNSPHSTRTAPRPSTPCVLLVQSCFSGESEAAVRAVELALAACRACVLERRPASPTAFGWHAEVRLSGAMELYAQLLAAGLRLSRASHASLAALCSPQAMQGLQWRAGAVLELHLELTVLEQAGFGLAASSPAA